MAETKEVTYEKCMEKLIKAAEKKKNLMEFSEIDKHFKGMELDDDMRNKIAEDAEKRGIDVLRMDFFDDQIILDIEEDQEEIDEEIAEAENLDLNDIENNVNIEDHVRIYLKDIGKVQLLSSDEEIELAKRMEAGERAKKKVQQLLLSETAIEQAKAQQLLPLNEDDEEENDPAEVIQKLSFGKSIEIAKKLQLVSSDEAIEFSKKKELGEQARKRLAEANLRLVVSIAKRYVGRGMQLLDLIEEGNLGLMKAVEKFDYKKGYKFSTYATWWIRQAITRAIADQARTIRIPVHMVETINKHMRVSRQLLQELGREPTNEEIAERMDIPVARVREIIKYSLDPVSLETPIGEEEDSHLGDFIKDDQIKSPSEEAAMVLLKEQLREVLFTLTEREQEVIILRFGLYDGRSRTLEEVGKVFNVTRERIRQIEAKALRKLRHPSRARKLKDYID